MAVTPFKFPPLFRKPKTVEISKRLGVRPVVVDYSNNFLLTLQDSQNATLLEITCRGSYIVDNF